MRLLKNEQLNTGNSNQFTNELILIPFLCPFGTHTLFKALLSFYPLPVGFRSTEIIFCLPLLSTLHSNLGHYFVPNEFSLMGLNSCAYKWQKEFWLLLSKLSSHHPIIALHLSLANCILFIGNLNLEQSNTETKYKN